MLSVKLVRSLVLGENISTPSPTTTHHHDGNQNDDDDDHHHHYHHHHHHDKLKKKKMPMLLFTPTRELITDTFRLATIARDLGMDFYPNSSLSHLLFSWPSSSSSPSYPYPSSSSNNTNHRTSVSSQTSTFTHTSSSTATTSTTTLSANTLQNDAVPIPFPSLSTNSSISLLRSFVSLSKGVFKLVFFDLNPNPNSNSEPIFINYYHNLINYDAPVQLSLFSRVSGKRVKSIDDLSKELAGKGWSLFRSPVKKKSSSSSSLALSSPLLLENSVYLFRKMESNRVRVKAGNGGGESRVRELRLPAIDFEKEYNACVGKKGLLQRFTRKFDATLQDYLLT